MLLGDSVGATIEVVGTTLLDPSVASPAVVEDASGGGIRLIPGARDGGTTAEPVFVMDVNPTAENIARLVYNFVAAQGFPVVEVQLWETDACQASYRGRGD